MSDDELFLTAIFNCNRSELYIQARTLNDDQKLCLEAMRQRKQAGEPIQYICGFTNFMGSRIEVGPGVLIPRPETEVLVDSLLHVLKDLHKRDLYLLDIGSGSGCIPIALLKAFPTASVLSLDISAEALYYAQMNAVKNAVANRLTLIQKDVFIFLDECKSSFDVIISNPPYIATNDIGGLPADVRHEPKSALDGGMDGLSFYRTIIPKAVSLLHKEGWLALEFGDGQRKELEKLFAFTEGWDKILFIKDNAGRDRIVLGQRSQF